MRIVISLLVEFKRSNAYFEAEALLYENFVAIHLFEVLKTFMRIRLLVEYRRKFYYAQIELFSNFYIIFGFHRLKQLPLTFRS